MHTIRTGYPSGNPEAVVRRIDVDNKKEEELQILLAMFESIRIKAFATQLKIITRQNIEPTRTNKVSKLFTRIY